MWISDFSITRPIVTIVAMLSLVLFGIVALFFLRTDEFPEVNPPVVAVSILYPGASPSSVERELVKPIEDGISGISGVDKISSTSFDSYALIVVEYVFEKDLQQATQDIRDAISAIRQDLPPEMEEPILTRFDPQDFPIVSMTLSSEKYSPAELTKLADPGITGELQGLSGVAQVNVIGGIQPELTVELHPEALQATGVSVGQVMQALQSANLAAPVGRVTTDREERTIRLQGRLSDPTDFEAITVYGAGGALIRLGDVATVRAGTEEARTMALFDGKEAVGIDIVKATNASTTDVSERVIARVAEIAERLPDGVDLTIVRDSGTRVDHSVSDVQKTLLEGAALTVLVVFLFLGSWRSTVITGLALPVSVLASFIMVWAFGFTLNTMSLLGLSLAVGILIDDAIVVRENIVRHMEMGKDHYQAAREGTAEIGLAVAATTFSIVVVFVPVAFMGGLAEQWMGPMALTIASSVMVSLFVSFSLDPMLSAYWADPVIEAGERGPIGRLIHRFDQWLERRVETYKSIIRWALNHRIAMLVIAVTAFVGALALPVSGLVGTSFFPVTDDSEFQVMLDLQPGASLDYTRAKALEASKIAAGHPGVMHTYVTIGGDSGAVDQATLYVKLVPKDERDLRQDEIAFPVVDEIDRLGGVTASMMGGFGPQKQIQLQLGGPDIEVLAELGDQIAEQIRTVPGAADVGLSTRGQRPELQVTIHRDLAASLGLSVGQVAQALRPAFAGIDVGDWVDPQGETRDVTVRFAAESRRKAEDLESLPLVVPTATGTTTIPLGQVADIEPGEGPAQIQHIDRKRVVVVEANPRDLPLSAVMEGINDKIEAFPMPPGYGVLQGGDVEAQQEVFGRMFGALGVAVLLMYLILVVQFGSFVDPIAIMASLPLSLIGVMLALLITGSTVNLMSMIGILLLMGIVAKNAILLIDFAKWAQEEQGIDRKSAIIEAGGIRLRPILMTSVAVVAGMIPVALGTGEGSEFRAPLGRAVIGGVITSTMLTLLVIPTFYDTLAGWRDRVWGWVFPASKADPHAGHGAPRPSPAPHPQPAK
ncbi:MAG: efflux RND transporter permease subunit [Myxococcota bacterium]